MKHVVIHYDEISLKGKNRPFFESILIKNLQDLSHLKNIKKEFGYLLAETEDEILDILSLIPGISNWALAEKSENSIDGIKKLAVDMLKNIKDQTFKFDAKRHNKNFEFKSPEINRMVGSYIGKNTNLEFSLDNPDIVVHVEVCNKSSFVYLNKNKGIGGLPVGSTGKSLCLLSGGIDSPVSAYLMMKRGSKVDFVHFYNETQSSDKDVEKIKDLRDILDRYQGKSKLYLIPFGKIQQELISVVPSKYRMIMYRRMMFRIAEKIAQKNKIKALVTGDNLAQVASQTMENMSVIQQATDMMVLRPLITYNKQETVDLAKKIDTYEISIVPYTDCCSFVIAKHPETKSRLSDIEKIEKGIGIDELLTSDSH